MKEYVLVALCSALYVVIGASAVTFQGGHMPRSIEVGGGETVTAYPNGVVYTGGSLMGGKRTLWQAADGSIMSSYVAVAWRALITIQLPATPAEIEKWSRAQKALATNT